MRYARHASRYSLFTLAVSAALLPGAGWAANGDLAGARKPPSVACSWNREAALSYEERRLDTPLPFSGANVVTHDQTPLAERIVKGAGFDGFEPAFAKRLCAADGRTPVTSYAKALKLVTEEGRALWRAAVDRAQGRRAIPAGALPASDDRMLYWTRLYMTRTLRQWAPSFHLGKAQAQALQWRFERASRGQLDIDLPRRYAADGSRYRRMIISGFDVFTLGTPGTANTGLRNGNPSGATALALDGREFRLADGSLLRIEAYLLPVSYDPFNRGMQEDTLGLVPPRPAPGRRLHHHQPGRRQPVLAGGLERPLPRLLRRQRRHRLLPRRQRFAQLRASPGQRDQSRHRADFPAGLRLQYQPAAPLARLRQRQPLAAEPAGTVLQGLAAGPPVARRRYLARHRAAAGRYQPGRGRLRRHLAHQLRLLPRLRQPAHRKRADQRGDERHARSLLVLPPNRRICARNGGGGDYLSNESAYRNTVLRDAFRLEIPAGHIHVPVMNNYYTGVPASGGGARNDNAISDARYEAYRSAIVAQTRALLVGVGNALAQGAQAD